MNKNHQGKLALSLCVATLISCSKEMKTQEFIWTPTSSEEIPKVLNSEQFKTNEVSLITAGESVERAPQKIGAAIVDGAYVQKVYDSNGALIYLKSVYMEQDLSKLTKEVAKLDTQKFAFLENFKKTDESLKAAYQVYPPKVVIQNVQGIPQAIYQIDFIDAARSGVYSMSVSPLRGLISTEIVSSAFEQGKGIVFPNGPKSSELAEVILPGLIGDGTLTKRNLQVNPLVNEKAHSANLVFDYDPQDVRFDQVQAFYFVDQTINFFANKLGVTLPFKLEVQTHFGAPEKVNAMFYYHGQIRLGTGDGVSYQNIMKDPSIVTHETCHALVEALSHLPMGQGEGGSLNEGFADYFTASRLNNPKLAEVAYMKGPFKRTVANDTKYSEKNGGLYHDSLILSGTFWEIRQALGEQKANALAVKTLTRLGPSGSYATVKSSVLNAASASNLSATETKAVENILAKREWP